MSSLRLVNLRECLRLSRGLLVQGFSNTNRCIKPYFISTSEPNSSNSFNQHANYCSKPSDNLNKRQRSMPALMSFPEIIWPSFINSFRNWVLVNFIIRPYFDNDFNLKDFIHGTKQAVHVISSKLANSNIRELTNLVSQEAIDEIKPIIGKMSVFQRKQLEINKDDIFLSFPYQVGIMFDESNEKKQKRFVEITMVFHVLRGYKEMPIQGEVLRWNIGSTPEYADNLYICNYRFIKEFTVGNETDWTVNIINHFKPADLLIDDV